MYRRSFRLPILRLHRFVMGNYLCSLIFSCQSTRSNREIARIIGAVASAQSAESCSTYGIKQKTDGVGPAFCTASSMTRCPPRLHVNHLGQLLKPVGSILVKPCHRPVLHILLIHEHILFIIIGYLASRVSLSCLYAASKSCAITLRDRNGFLFGNNFSRPGQLQRYHFQSKAHDPEP